MRRFFLVAALWLSAWVGIAAESPVRIDEAPAWAEIIEPELGPTPEADVSRGYDYRLLTRHVNAEEQATYYRTVYRITSESALQSGGRLTWTYDPAYEELILHHVRLIRDGVVQDRLSAGAVQVIQQERDLDRHILNGHLTALVLLEDVRVGDVIDFASTRRGWHPTFGGKFFGRWETRWSVPVRHQRFRMDVSAGRELRWKGHGPAAEPPVVTEEAGMTRFLWEAREMRPLESESETPSWFDAYSYLQFAEFGGWAETVTWAEPLYALPAELPESIVRQAELLTNERETPEAKTIALLDFVQQEVRYLGMELGAGSYRPNPPTEVLARRFGDCKDKTLLLCAMMRAVGLEAYPALVNTDYGARIDAMLPSPHVFDHVIVAIPVDDGYVWVDPTLMHQQGGWKYRGLPEYGRALVVRAGVEALTEVTSPPDARTTVRIEERFDVPAFDQPARYQVTTTFTGRRADGSRRYFSRSTPEQIVKDYVNYYESVYPGVKSVAPVTWSDDKEKNVLTSVEVYEVPQLWTKQDDGLLKAEFYPKNVSDYTTRPQQVVRSTPLDVSHPVDLEMTTIVNLPEPWNVTDSEKVLEDDAFRASTGIKGEGKVVTMRYTWRSRMDHVPAERMGAYTRTLNAYRESLGYTLSWRPSVAASETGPEAGAAAGPFRLNWFLVLVLVVTLGVAVPIAVKVAGWKPQTPPPIVPPSEAHLVGLGGWLWLVGFGVVARPLVLLGTAGTQFKALFNLDVWENLTIAGREAYQTWMGPLIVFELVGNTLMFTLSVLVLFLFFRKKRAFPAAFVTLLASAALFIALDTVAARMLITGVDGSGVGDLANAMGGAAIWIPYALVSRRVRATFTR